MKVKIKKEIVTLGVPGINPQKTVGKYVKPKDWNALISDPEVVLIDTRNAYETDIGSFEGAIIPETDGFREFPEWIKKVSVYLMVIVMIVVMVIVMVMVLENMLNQNIMIIVMIVVMAIVIVMVIVMAIVIVMVMVSENMLN